MGDATPSSAVYRTDPRRDPYQPGNVQVGGRRTASESRRRFAAIRAIQQGQSMVYAIRTPEGLIKIGCSRDVAIRRRHVGHEILAFRFGIYDDEQAIHRSLRDSVARGREYYHPTPEVLAVVNHMRTDLGLYPLVA